MIKNLTGWKANVTATSTYSYAETAYANPHASTDIAGNTLSYDNNGNLASYLGTTYTWDYRNRLTKTASTTNTLYTYDHTTARVSKGNGTATTTYPNKYITYTSATTTKYVYSPSGELLAFIETAGATSTRQYVHPDHLGSINVTTNASGTTTSVRDYLPFGASRINETSGIAPTNKAYIGIDRDTETGLDYALNRYYANERGQFISQDGVFWELQQNLKNPQSLNSYSYAENNPIIKKDPTGRCAGPFLLVCVGAGLGIVETYATVPNATLSQYAVGALGGIAQTALAAERIVVSGVLGFGTSLGQDRINNQPLDFSKATLTGFTNAFGLAYFKTLASGADVAARYLTRFSATVDSTTRSILGGITQTLLNIHLQYNLPLPSAPSSNPTSNNNQSSGSGSLSGAQATAISGVLSSFQPTNAAQAQAVSNLVSSFTNK